MARFRVFQSDAGIFQGRGLGQDPEDGLQGLVQIQGLAKDLANLRDNLDLGFFEFIFHA